MCLPHFPCVGWCLAVADPGTTAIAPCAAAERAAGKDPATQARARAVTAAAVAGDETTIAAAASGDMNGAPEAAAKWRQQQEERQRAAAAEARGRPHDDPDIHVRSPHAYHRLSPTPSGAAWAVGMGMACFASLRPRQTGGGKRGRA